MASKCYSEVKVEEMSEYIHSLDKCLGMSAVSGSILRHTEEQINPERLLGKGERGWVGKGKRLTEV